MVSFRDVWTAEETLTIRPLFQEYAARLDLEPGFQDFFPRTGRSSGTVCPPAGALLLTCGKDVAVGCMDVRTLQAPTVAELKRLYARPTHRGRGLGVMLASAAIAGAAKSGTSAFAWILPRACGRHNESISTWNSG